MFTQGRIRVIALMLVDAITFSFVWSMMVCGYWGLGWFLKAQGFVTAVGGYCPLDYLEFWPVLIVFILLNTMMGLYQGHWMYPSASLPPVEEMRRLVGSSFLTHLGVMAYLGFVFQTTEGYSRMVIAVSGLGVAFLAQPIRNLMRRVLKRSGLGQIPVVLSGAGLAARRVALALADDIYSGYKIVGYFSGSTRMGRAKRRRLWHERDLTKLGIPYLGTWRDIVPEARKRDIKILLACQDERLFRLQLEAFVEWFTYIDYVPSARAFPVFGSRALSFDGVGGIELMNQRRMRALRLQKHILDRLFSVLAFLFLLPVFILIPILIKLTSRGPVFFRHTRLGRGGRLIRVWKFRSMYQDAESRLEALLKTNPALADEWARHHKLRHDPRVTPIGRLLRLTSLDELPQFFNVFLGEMALIGPRPIVSSEVAYYGDDFRVMSSVNPGITGLWQVSGRSDVDYEQRVALDLYYVLNWSPWMDIWILLKTISAVLTFRGAH